MALPEDIQKEAITMELNKALKTVMSNKSLLSISRNNSSYLHEPNQLFSELEPYQHYLDILPSRAVFLTEEDEDLQWGNRQSDIFDRICKEPDSPTTKESDREGTIYSSSNIVAVKPKRISHLSNL